ncbi:MAG: CsgG/HfaB family protein, partial [Treponema sp.]|nr:CsgG/HfaB family protein [Treponema sp.]
MKRLGMSAVLCAGLWAAVGLAAQSAPVPLDQAIAQAAAAVEQALGQGVKVAVLNFSSPAEGFSDYVIEELNGLLVQSKKLTIVDRRSLELIRKEMDVQASGEVSDESAQAIGKRLGAQFIVSGALLDLGDAYR